MSRPGDRLRAIAARVCSPRALERVLDPAIADVRWEHQDALRRHRRWRARWLRITGSLTVLYLIVRQASVDGAVSHRRSPTAPITRVLAASAALVGVMTALLIAILMSNTPFRVEQPWFFLYLLPATLPFTVPWGFALAVAWIHTRWCWQSACQTLVVASVLSVMTLVTVGWILPAANQAYRAAVFGGPVSTGFNELTLPEMRRRLAEERERLSLPFGADRNPIDPTVDISESEYSYQSRLAVSVAPLAFGLFAFGVSARRRALRMLGMISMVVVHFAWYGGMRSPVATFSALSPTVVAWSPNAMSVLAAVMLLASPSPAQKRIHRST